VKVAGLGYSAEYFTLDDHEVIHAAVHHVDYQVRAVAPVWLPHIAPEPLCGLGAGAGSRTLTRRSNGPLCRRCAEHLRDLDEWVRQAEGRLGGMDLADLPPPRSRVHAMPF
jgi:hypothetical protein